MSFVEIPLLNPIRFVEDDPTNPYNTRHFDDYRYRDQVREFEYFREYYQKWQTNDIIRLQVLSDIGPIQLELYGCDGIALPAFTQVLNTVATSLVDPGFDVYEATFALASVPVGSYYFKLTGTGFSFKSELFEVATFHDYTALFEYTNDINDYDVIFQRTDGPLTFSYRAEVQIEQYEPGSRNVVFVDQNEELVQLKATSFRVQKLIIGDATGVPDYVADKVMRIFDCSSVSIDGKGFVRPEGATMEAQRVDLYPMPSWSLNIREANNRQSKRVSATGDANNPTVAYNIRTRGFGSQNEPASNNIVKIISIQ